MDIRRYQIRITMTRTHPPVFVPPARSKTSHGRGISGNLRLCCIRYRISLKISRADSPRIPPPSVNRVKVRFDGQNLASPIDKTCSPHAFPPTKFGGIGLRRKCEMTAGAVHSFKRLLGTLRQLAYVDSKSPSPCRPSTCQ